MPRTARAVHEGSDYGDDGQLPTTTSAEYHVRTAMEAPVIVTDRLASPAPSNPLVVGGPGESGCIGAPPASVNAVLDALTPSGVRDLQMAMTSRTVRRAIQAARPAP